jgi:hypothetical protein
MIIETYFEPNKTFPELRDFLNSEAFDPLRAFSEECRAELRAPKYPQARACPKALAGRAKPKYSAEKLLG